MIMEIPKFLPVVIEIVIDGDGRKSFICRNPNGVVMQILHETSEISKFVDDLCVNLVSSVSCPVRPSDSVKLTSTK